MRSHWCSSSVCRFFHTLFGWAVQGLFLIGIQEEGGSEAKAGLGVRGVVLWVEQQPGVEHRQQREPTSLTDTRAV